MQKRRKQRLEGLSVDINSSHINPLTGTVEINVSFDVVNNEFKVFLDHTGEVINSTSQVRSYFGDFKIRKLLEVPKDSNDHSVDELKKLSRYNKIFGIDSNTTLIEDTKVSIGVACCLVYEVDDVFNGWVFKPIPNPFPLVYLGDLKIENYNWRQLINYIMAHQDYEANHLIGIVVDSDLENLSDYNKKVLPIIDNFYLPPNFELIYASDKAMDSPLNGVIKHCHKLANAILSQVKLKSKQSDQVI
jgi:hypothetical protein